jgi:hypothetical protein
LIQSDKSLLPEVCAVNFGETLRLNRKIRH